MEVIISQVLSMLINSAFDFFDYNINVQKGLFIGFLLGSIMIFFVFAEILIWSLNNNIWKSKRLLALYPLQHAAQNWADFRTTLSKLT